MRSLTAALALGCALLVRPAPLVGQSSAPRTVSFDTRYAFDTYSNEAWGHFGIEALDLTAVPTEAITMQGAGGNLLRGIVLVISTDFVAKAFKLSFHEFGHGTRAAAAGFRPRFGYGEAPAGMADDEILASQTLHGGFLPYFLGSFFRAGGYTYLAPGDQLFAPPSEDELVQAGWELIWKAGGLNNEMYFTQRLEERIRRGGGHAGMLSSHVRGKIATIQYAAGRRTGDVGGILEWYQAQGYDVDRHALRKGGWISLLASSTTYELAYRLARVLVGDSIRFEPWTPYGVELPDVGFFMTTSGPSYRVSTGYRRGRWRFPVAVEHVFNGRTRTEFTVGSEWGPGPYYFGVRATYGERLGGAVFVDRRIADRFVVSGGYALYDHRNLYGERMIPSLESGSRYHDVFLRLGVVY